MGFPSYRGPVETVGDAALAHMVIDINCQRCSRSNSIWAYTLIQRGQKVAALPLKRAVEGFYCKGCRQRVSAWLSARHSEEL